ncbi:HAMP domain-containing sensor histidine kinase [Roseitalea sp. MMSF_3504]|nr:HAMP domain-containing sensor histidine kinase [Roseitalea sp. MMSF_3504]
MAVARRLGAMMKTTAVRLSALYLVLFSVCAVLLVVYMTSLAASFFVGETRRAVEGEIESLSSVYARGGMRSLVVAIDRRSRAPGAFVYLVADPRGRIIAGNVEDLEPGVLDSRGWVPQPFYYQKYRDGRPGAAAPRAIGHVTRFDNGLRVLVGRDLAEPQLLRLIVRRSVALALGLMALGGLLIWFFVGRRALRRIDAVSAASDDIVAGDLGRRLPVSAANDEFDRLSVSLNTMLARIETLNNGLREVSDSIAHDLKTPLTRLRNRAEDALRKDPGQAGYRDALEDMIAEADHLISLFNAMLLISRVEAGYTRFTPQPVDLAAVAAELAELYEPLVEDAGGRLENAVAGPLVVEGNRELIGQAVTNLIDNAIKYGLAAPGGVVRLEGRRDEVARRVELAVCDTGPGIAEADRARALRRFERLDESRSRAGSGLGLSLVDAIQRQHGGTLRLEDNDPGLCAVLSFPAPASPD